MLGLASLSRDTLSLGVRLWLRPLRTDDARSDQLLLLEPSLVISIALRVETGVEQLCLI